MARHRRFGRADRRAAVGQAQDRAATRLRRRGGQPARLVADPRRRAAARTGRAPARTSRAPHPHPRRRGHGARPLPTARSSHALRRPSPARASSGRQTRARSLFEGVKLIREDDALASEHSALPTRDADTSEHAVALQPASAATGAGRNLFLDQDRSIRPSESEAADTDRQMLGCHRRRRMRTVRRPSSPLPATSATPPKRTRPEPTAVTSRLSHPQCGIADRQQGWALGDR